MAWQEMHPLQQPGYGAQMQPIAQVPTWGVNFAPGQGQAVLLPASNGSSNLAFGSSSTTKSAPSWPGSANSVGASPSSGMSAKSTSSAAGKGKFYPGDTVEAVYENTNCWYPAQIHSQMHEGVYQINWDNGDTRDRIKAKQELRKVQDALWEFANDDSFDIGSSLTKKTEEKKEMPPGEQYKAIMVDSVPNNVCLFFKHWSRANEQEGLLTNVASKVEWNYIYKHTGIWSPVLTNMLVWRRSLMMVLLLVMFVATTSKTTNVWTAHQYAQYDHSVSAMELPYSDWKPNAGKDGKDGSFADYSLAVAHETRRLIKGQSDFVQAGEDGCIALLSMFSLLLVIRANNCWVNIRISRKFVLYAWFFTVAAPFFGSLVPARLFVDWSAANNLLQIYQVSFEKQFQVDHHMSELVRNCDRVRKEGKGKIDQSARMFEKVCGVVDMLPTGDLHVPSGWNIFKKWLDVPLDPAHQGCAQGRAIIKSGKPEAALAKCVQVCNSLDKMLKDYKDSNGQAPDMVKYVVKKARGLAETSVTLSLAMGNLGQLLPAALSIAPGLMKGATRMKLLVPQSPIPGMFMLVLPWMYCPLTWSLYSVFSHLMGSILLLMGLFMVAWNPLIYVIMGWRHKLDSPMRDDQAVAATKAIGKAMLWANLFGLACLLGYVIEIIRIFSARYQYNEAHKDSPEDAFAANQENQWVDTVLEHLAEQYNDDPSAMYWMGFFNLFLTLCSTFEKYFLTSVAGFDWMMGRMVDLRRVERDLDEDMQAEYTTRMDQMLSLTSGKHYTKWVKGEWKAYEKKQEDKRKKWWQGAQNSNAPVPMSSSSTVSMNRVQTGY